MGELIRTFALPPTLSEDAVVQLTAAMQGLPEKQERLAALTRSAAKARAVERRGHAIDVHYELEETETAGSAISTGPLDSATLLEWASQICTVFGAAYPPGESALLRHGGLCPAAVVVAPENQLVVLDFGVAECFATALEPQDESWLLQVAGNVAPEVWNTPSRFGQQSDIFSVGVLLYELATGKHPFGAIREDAEDCKYQILVEVPVPPRRRNAVLDERLSNFIHKAIRSEPERRYRTFQEMLEALEICKRERTTEQTVTASRESREERDEAFIAQEGPRELKLTARELAAQGQSPPLDTDAGEKEQRRQYLEEQARLKSQRQQAEQRQDERRQRARQVRARIRRHALALTGALLALTIATGGLFVMTRRAANGKAVRELLSMTEAQLNGHFTGGEPEQLARALAIDRPSRRLIRGLADLAKVAPAAKLGLASPTFDDLLRCTGHSKLALAGGEIAVGFVLDSHGEGSLQFEVNEAELIRSVNRSVDELARAQMDTEVRELARKLQDVFRDSATVSEAIGRLNDLGAQVPPAARPPAATDSEAAPDTDPSARPRDSGLLGYLAYQGDRKSIELGPFKPVPGEQAIESEVRLLGGDPGAPGEILETHPRALFWYVCSESGCRLQKVSVEPVAEPAEHRLWCIEMTTDRISQAFRTGDAATLARLTNPDQLEDIQRTLAWTQQCKSAELGFDLLDAGPPAALAHISYQPGALPGSESTFETGRLEFAFSAAHEWGVRPTSRNDWPGIPDPLLRQQLGVELLGRFEQAWNKRDAQAYLRLFENTHRDAEAAAAMFARIEEDSVSVEIRAREGSNSDIVLIIELRADSPASYPPKEFEYVVEGGSLTWNPQSDDPVWIIAGDAFNALANKLEKCDWQSIDRLEIEFENVAQGDMTSAEHARMRAWIDAIKSARGMFEPQSEDYIWGFARRVSAKGRPAAPMTFHLITLPGDHGNIVYIAEREVRVTDILPHWSRADQPWELWRRIVGPPPAGQAVGLGLSEAKALAAELGCEIPRLSEWRGAVDQIPAVAEMAFRGGVWELCSDDTDDDTAVIVGGCWYDADLEFAEAGDHQGLRLSREGRFGTVGFRLCKRFHVPIDALDRSARSAAATSRAP